MTTIEDVTPNVARGAAVLDAKMPGWASCVDVSRLHIGCCADCIVGQLYGDYYRGVQMLRPPDDEGTRADWAFEHGFNIHSGDLFAHIESHSLGVPLQSPYVILQQAWVAAIVARSVREVAELVNA